MTRRLLLRARLYRNLRQLGIHRRRSWEMSRQTTRAARDLADAHRRLDLDQALDLLSPE